MKVHIESVRFVADKHGLLTGSRKRELVYKRYVCFNFLKKNTALSLTAIGDLLGGYDHASVLYGLKVYDDLNKYEDFQRCENDITPDLAECFIFEDMSKCIGTNEVMSMVKLENLIQERL